MTSTVRRPAVAGSFYSSDPAELRQHVMGYLQNAAALAKPPAMLITPHAGYVFSGPIAGSAFATWRDEGQGEQRVVVIGPSHYHRFYGIALSSAGAYETPLGTVEIDAELVTAVRELPGVVVDDTAHGQEHSIEVELPFLQTIWPDRFTLLPLVVGWADIDQVAGVLAAALRVDPGLKVVVSSDLSHFLPYDEARSVDRATAEAIVDLQTELHPRQACGAYALNGALQWAGTRGLEAHLLDLRNSGDTHGDREQVVGYGAFAFGAPQDAGERS